MALLLLCLTVSDTIQRVIINKMNRLAVSRSARTQQAQRVETCYKSNNGLMALHKIKIGLLVVDPEFYSSQHRQSHADYT